MSTLEVKIPDLLLKQVNEVAAKERVSVDQLVSAALTLQPQLISRAAIENGVPGLDRLLKGFGVHETHHQYAAGPVI